MCCCHVSVCSWALPVGNAHLDCRAAISVVVDGGQSVAPNGSARVNPIVSPPATPCIVPTSEILTLPTALGSQNTRLSFESAEDIAPASTLVGPAAQQKSFANLLHLLRQADAMEIDAMHATQRESRFAVHVLHGIIQVRLHFALLVIPFVELHYAF